MKYVDVEQKFLVEILLIFLLPILLIKFGILPESVRLLLLTLGVIAVGIIITRERWKAEDVGIRFDNIKKALPTYTLFTAGGLILLILYANVLNLPTLHVLGGKNAELKLILTFLPVSLFQEFLYRGFLMKMLKQIFKSETHTIILVNATLFALLHVIYPHQLFVIPLVFIGGVFFAAIYHKMPNLILVSVAHAILNYAALTLGFFVVN